MKKIIALAMSFVALMALFAACTSKTGKPSSSEPGSSVAEISQGKAQGQEEDPTAKTAQATPTTELQTTQTAFPEYVPGSIELTSPEGIRDMFDMRYVPEYRFVYYTVPGCITELVADQEAKAAWFEQNGSSSAPATRMLMAAFVKDFNIPKEEFIRVFEEEKRISIKNGDDIYYEMTELPNADIIYTFDNEIINYYYRRA
jgi:hypothetical protein